VGVSAPEGLFKPFQQGADATGLRLYVSHAVLRSFGGELVFEARSEGCCFAVNLTRINDRQEAKPIAVERPELSKVVQL
jgi:two-component system, LuxR family, sensor kinase FixL